MLVGHVSSRVLCLEQNSSSYRDEDDHRGPDEPCKIPGAEVARDYG